MILFPSSVELTIFTKPALAQQQVPGSDVQVPVEVVQGVKSGNRALWRHGEQSYTAEYQIRLSRKLARRAIEWYELIHAQPFKGHYDCMRFALACVNGLMPASDYTSARSVKYNHRRPTNPNGLTTNKVYAVVPAEGEVPDHAMLATDAHNVLHVAGPNGEFVYSTAEAATTIWPGRIYPVISMEGFHTIGHTVYSSPDKTD